VARHGGEEESDDQHDDGGGDAGQYELRHINVQGRHRKEGQEEKTEHDAEAHIAFRPVERFHLRRARAHFGEGLGKAQKQVLAHAEQSVARTDHHAADSDGPYDVAPNGGGEIEPSGIGCVGVGRQVIPQLRAKEVDEQRNQEAPGDHAAGKVQRCEFGPDNVSYAEKRGTYGRGGDGRYATGGQHLRGSSAAQREPAAIQLADIEEEILVRRKEIECAQQKSSGAEGHVIEEILGGLGARLAGLVDLRGSDRFGERQIGVLD
jgi:hypothetical protein